jgi:DNA-binding response OmpR family regulator
MLLLNMDRATQASTTHGEPAGPSISAGLPPGANDTAIGPVVMVADDETDLTDEICSYLGRNGIQPIAAHNFADAIKILTTRHVDAILLDQRFGPVDTLPLLPTLRMVTQAPILIHTGNRDEADRVQGLELGADDFLLKPVSGRELVARLRAWLRHVPPQTSPPANGAQPAPVQMALAIPHPPEAGWRILTNARRLHRPDGTPLRLTSAEFDILAALAAKPGEVRSREELTRQVFRRSWRPGDRAVDNAVLHLRQKLAEEFSDGCIVTVRQIGYVFTGFPKP